MFNMVLRSFIVIFFTIGFTYCAVDPGCPDPPNLCKRCIKTCPRNEVLVKSSCGCCENKCVPRTKCPDRPIFCLWCFWTCPENQTLEVSPCGCCHNRCVPNSDPECPCDICSRIRCGIPTCEAGYILAQGEGYCGCCQGCVKPEEGDKCYVEVNTGNPTCGEHMQCCKGKCTSTKVLCPKC